MSSKEYYREYYLKNKKRILKRQKKKRQNATEEERKKEKERTQKYYIENKERINNRNKKYYQEHKESTYLRVNDWRRNNPEAIKRILKRHKQKNPQYKIKCKECTKKWKREQIRKLGDWYIKILLTAENNILKKNIPQELIEVQRYHLLIKRFLGETNYGYKKD